MALSLLPCFAPAKVRKGGCKRSVAETAQSDTWSGSSPYLGRALRVGGSTNLGRTQWGWPSLVRCEPVFDDGNECFRFLVLRAMTALAENVHSRVRSMRCDDLGPASA
jgi:hypothetical protein